MNFRSIVSRNYRRLKASLEFYRNETVLPGFVPRGHFYSPLPNLSSAEKLPNSDECAGVDLNADGQHEILLRMVEFYPEFDWGMERKSNARFHFDQGYFKQADSMALYTLMRLFHPKRVIEVGSGFSSALMLDINDRFLDGQTEFTFIDPFPERLDETLRPGDFRSAHIIKRPVQECPPSAFAELQSNDMLFIDSSHVAKIGSDVNYLCFEILPRLARGVLVHVHDIFWPFQYPSDWVREGRAWNEAYLLRAFLCFNSAFEIVFWAPFAATKWREVIGSRMPDYLKDTGASLWLRRVS